MKKINVYVEGDDQSITSMFKERNGYEVVHNINHTDLLCLEGGADLSPFIYGEKNTRSHNSVSKDFHTFGLMAIAQRMRIPIVGICRGAQALNVFMGGKMNQHIDGHGKLHLINTPYGFCEVRCGHHQEIIPPKWAEVYRAEDDVAEIVIFNQSLHGDQMCHVLLPHRRLHLPTASGIEEGMT